MAICNNKITAIQTHLTASNNRLLPLEETIEDWNEAENGDQEEIYTNNNTPTKQKEKQQSCRPEFPITENYIKRYAETARSILKIGIIGIVILEGQIKKHLNGKINSKVSFNVF